MKYVITGREPKLALKYFEDIAAIPHGSYNEKAVAEFIKNRAEELGLYARMDRANNVVVKKPATLGYEHLPAVLLQAHTDMVNEKNKDTVHDFEKDGLELIVEGNILRANGTTLGADDGKGVAYMLALMDEDSDKFPHPPLEFAFTSMEEVGLIGAMKLDCSDITARKLIGLDAGPEGVICTTSAGAQEIIVACDTQWEDARGEAVKITVDGLLGGHSAMNITDEKGNANKIMGRILHNVAKVCDFRICNVTGGMMFNAIPREAEAVITVVDGNKDAAVEMINTVFEQLKTELKASDAGVNVQVSDCTADRILSATVTKTVTEALYTIPNGVRMMSKEVEGLPVTSTNMGVVKTLEDKITINTMLRSSSRSVNDDYVDNIITVAQLCGMYVDYKGDWMPAWPYMAESELRPLVKRLYNEKTGGEIKEFAVHGGLELGVFSEKLPGVDIVTLGCTSGNEHTVTEWMDLDSYERVYEFIKELLTELTK
ncbi:MAG: beta-Ala-His dipeptidase [Oscillospiraceae bacterium]|nr:beta-Ala-His dipeptidase [Oscillospiraceae bacterium]